ncbi:MAG: response regulator [Vicinamibacterales bacterium]
MSASVLIVDDSPTVRADLQDAFEREGFTVRTAGTMQDGAAAIEEGGFGVVVLDIVLPDGDGLELLRRIRAGQQTASLPVMLLSTEAEVGSRIRGLKVGADDYVGKPYDRGHVVDRARQLMTASGAPEIAPMTGRVVLVVEPSQTYRAALAEVLEQVGYTVMDAEGGHEALRRVASLRPNMVILNSHSPGLDGAAVVQQIRLDPALRRTVCVLILDAEEPGAELRALAAGADASIRKDEELGVVAARLRAVDRAAEATAGVPAAAGVVGPKKVLAIDPAHPAPDFAATLRRDGYDVVVAQTAREALELLGVQLVDCIVLELELPDLSGVELMKVIRSAARWRATPIVVRPSRESSRDMVDSLASGADDYVPRSAGHDILSARIRAVLRRKQIEEEDRRYRDALIRKEAEAAEARLRAELAETRTALLEDVSRTNQALTQANRALAAAKEKAEQESQFKSRFLAIMSHELRTPLNAILGFAQLLERGTGGELTDRQTQQVSALLRNSRQLLVLVNDMLDLSKIQAGKMTLQLDTLDVRSELDTAWQSALELASARGIEFAVEGDERLPPLVADPFRLQQILGNLLTNAMKFTPEGGRVTLAAHAEGAEIVLSVQDTGIGIRAEDLPRLFREFERLESGRVQRAEGTGLGLALTRHLVDLHGGRIDVESEPGVGSTFSVRLPAEHVHQA